MPYIIVNYIYHVVHYITSTYLPYNWKFHLLPTFIQFPLPPAPASGNYKSDLFFYEFSCLFVCLFVFEV